MAPRTRNSDKRSTRGRKKDIRFPRRELSARKSPIIIRPPENYENLILYYLTKLKRLFSSPDHPHPTNNENSADKMRREQSDKRISETKSKLEIDPDKYTARRSTPKPRDDSEHDIKEKVFNVVNAAIEYGFANNVLERKGDCFIFRNKKNQKLANRQPTPGPSSLKRSFCSKCNCTRCKNVSDNESNHGYYQGLSRPFSEHNPQRQQHSEKRPNTSGHPSRFGESKSQSLSRAMNKVSLTGRRSSRSKSCIFSRSSLKDRAGKVCFCRKCRLLAQRKKSQRK